MPASHLYTNVGIPPRWQLQRGGGGGLLCGSHLSGSSCIFSLLSSATLLPTSLPPTRVELRIERRDGFSPEDSEQFSAIQTDAGLFRFGPVLVCYIWVRAIADIANFARDTLVPSLA